MIFLKAKYIKHSLGCCLNYLFNLCYLLSFLGFVFSESEGSALEQFEGGPCAVIAPVQAFLLKKLLFSSEKSSWRDCPGMIVVGL